MSENILIADKIIEEIAVRTFCTDGKAPFAPSRVAFVAPGFGQGCESKLIEQSCAVIAELGYMAVTFDPPGTRRSVPQDGSEPQPYSLQRTMTAIDTVLAKVLPPNKQPERLAAVGYSIGSILVTRALADKATDFALIHPPVSPEGFAQMPAYKRAAQRRGRILLPDCRGGYVTVPLKPDAAEEYMRLGRLDDVVEGLSQSRPYQKVLLVANREDSLARYGHTQELAAQNSNVLLHTVPVPVDHNPINPQEINHLLAPVLEKLAQPPARPAGKAQDDQVSFYSGRANHYNTAYEHPAHGFAG